MSDELTTKQIIEGIERNLAAWEEGEGYRGGYDFDAERALVKDLRTLLEITKTSLENVTIDVPGPGGVTQRYTVSGVVTVEPTDTVRIEPITSRPDGASMIRVDVPNELLLTTSGKVHIATDQPFSLETIPPARGAVREYR
jgi:hypothetical protein